jgi:hypothetical protein
VTVPWPENVFLEAMHLRVLKFPGMDTELELLRATWCQVTSHGASRSFSKSSVILDGSPGIMQSGGRGFAAVEMCLLNMFHEEMGIATDSK